MDIILTETNKGKRSLVCDSFRYRVDKTLKGEEISWRCTAKGCKARLRTDCTGTVIIQQKNTHNHDTSDRDNERHLLRVRSKRKADDDIAQRPSKIQKNLFVGKLLYVNTAEVPRPRTSSYGKKMLRFEAAQVWKELTS
ncbi:uncharacterized protein LOC134692239 [Mytilus trossulus]|uniref:uncharacterized protein LOC134692239 n=1 Tax=Mytilus trossulus TaxID=6551 RepID=UPI003004A7AA